MILIFFYYISGLSSLRFDTVKKSSLKSLFEQGLLTPCNSKLLRSDLGTESAKRKQKWVVRMPYG
jgi:hypothetical protein